MRSYFMAAVLVALPALGQDGDAAARAREVMHRALEQELAVPAQPPSLPAPSRADPGSAPGKEAPKGQGDAHRSDVAAQHADQASGEARQQVQRGLERAADERAAAASDNAASQSRAAAAKKAAAGKGKPPHP